MKFLTLFLIGSFAILSCQMNLYKLEVCDYKMDIQAPEGFDINPIGGIEFNGSVRGFQFVDASTGYALLNTSAGSYAEVFKTANGGHTWTHMPVGIKQHPRGLAFRNENFGIITVHDVTGCPPPNCQHKCVIIRTEDGGMNWEEVEFGNLKGILYYPKFDDQGNLYANLSFDDQSVLMKSINSGESWDTLYKSTDPEFLLTTFNFEIFNDKIYTPTKNGDILVIITNGELVKALKVNNSRVREIEILDENNLVIVVSGGVVKSTDGGVTWQSIYHDSARIIGFDTAENGLMLLEKSYCPTDVYQVNDLIAFTNDGGTTWNEAEETTTNLSSNFTNSQEMAVGVWYFMIDNDLFEIREQ